MVTYFNKKDLVSFGNYLLSDERKENFQTAFDENVKNGMSFPMSVEESLKSVHHADICNWIEKQSK